jgi:AcrR family transcriptional regulator
MSIHLCCNSETIIRQRPHFIGASVSVITHRRSRDLPRTLTERRPVRGRKPTISPDDLVEAALSLVGPHRSISTLSLREVARAAGIAPNSFYRQFRDMDELAVAVIDRAGTSLREIIGEARQRASRESSVVQASVQTFMQQLRSDDKLLHILLREGTVGSPAFKAAVDRQLRFFEDELQQDLIRIANATGSSLYQSGTSAKAITRLVFAMGASIMDLPQGRDPEVADELVIMVRMILRGAQAIGASNNAERPVARAVSGRVPRRKPGSLRKPQTPG